MRDNLSKRLLNIYDLLFNHYGPQHWWPGESQFEIIIGAILTQATAWTNVEKAILNLKAARLLSPKALRRSSHQRLSRLLRPAVYFNAKSVKLKAFVIYLGDNYDDNFQRLFSQESEPLREELLKIYGIGEETADDILLYAGEKAVFVIDNYTRRLFNRLGLKPEGQSYSAYQQFFQDHLPRDVDLYNEYHALIDRHAAEVCKSKKPDCGSCCLLHLCPTGKYFASL